MRRWQSFWSDAPDAGLEDGAADPALGQKAKNSPGCFSTSVRVKAASGGVAILQALNQRFPCKAIGEENGRQINLGRMAGGSAAFPLLAKLCKDWQAEVERTALEEVQLPLDLVERRTKRDFSRHGIGFLKKQPKHLGKAVFAEF
jgi:hypothetical protein